MDGGRDDLPPQVQRIMDRIPDRWGKWIDVGPGWHRLLAALDEDLAQLAPAYEVHQCKAKFGGLRFYAEANIDDPEVRQAFSDRIRLAEQQSERTCEDCGENGHMVDIKGWSWALCAVHAHARKTAQG